MPPAYFRGIPPCPVRRSPRRDSTLGKESIMGLITHPSNRLGRPCRLWPLSSISLLLARRFRLRDPAAFPERFVPETRNNRRSGVGLKGSRLRGRPWIDGFPAHLTAGGIREPLVVRNRNQREPAKGCRCTLRNSGMSRSSVHGRNRSEPRNSQPTDSGKRQRENAGCRTAHFILRTLSSIMMRLVRNRIQLRWGQDEVPGKVHSRPQVEQR